MSILLWALQILLALHTAMGAVWKFSHSELTVPSLSAIPHGVWLVLTVVELVCSAVLVVPLFKKSLNGLVPAAALFITAEMLAFMAVNLSSGSSDRGQILYWLVVAVLSGLLAYGRLVLNRRGRRSR